MIVLREKPLGKSFCSFDPITMSIIGGGAAQIGGSIFGGLFGSSAEKKRAAAIEQAGLQGSRDILKAVTDANATSKQYLDMARGDLSPFRGFGVDAGNSLMGMLLGTSDVTNMLKASPLFNFQSELGSRNMNRELAARGLYGSGAGLESLARFNAQLVGEEGQRLTDRLFNLTQLGAGSAQGMAGMTTNTGNSMANMIYGGGIEAANMLYNSKVGAAQARSNATQMLGQMGQNIFNQVGGGMQQFGNFMMNKPILDSLIGAGGGAGGGVPYSASAGKRFSFTGETGLEGLANYSVTG